MTFFPDLGARHQNEAAAPLTRHAINAVRALIDQGNSLDCACEKYCNNRLYSIPLEYLTNRRDKLLRDSGIYRAIARYEMRRELRVKKVAPLIQQTIDKNFPKELASIISGYYVTEAPPSSD